VWRELQDRNGASDREREGGSAFGNESGHRGDVPKRSGRGLFKNRVQGMGGQKLNPEKNPYGGGKKNSKTSRREQLATLARPQLSKRGREGDESKGTKSGKERKGKWGGRRPSKGWTKDTKGR